MARIMEGQYDSVRNDKANEQLTVREMVARRETLLKLLEDHPGNPGFDGNSREQRDEYRSMEKQIEALQRQIAGLPPETES